jgi:hypothetical protein
MRTSLMTRIIFVVVRVELRFCCIENIGTTHYRRQQNIGSQFRDNNNYINNETNVYSMGIEIGQLHDAVEPESVTIII